ncbi:MAG TPA: hypothetical protein VHO43_04600 [Ignavibacteriales bacterium]|nr:hypothetical protein [Ignavibacteriales bacterium]
MKGNKLTFIVFAVIFLFISLGIDMRNVISNGEIFRMNGDFLDQIHFYLQIPGAIPVFLVVRLFFKDSHAYNFYFLWSLTLLLNCLFYGFAGYWIYPAVKNLFGYRQKNAGKTGETRA